MKMAVIVDRESGCRRIQQDIDQLEIWTLKWQMEFNPDDQCKRKVCE